MHLKDTHALNKLVQDGKSKRSVIENLLQDPKQIISLFNSSSIEDVEMLFQDKCSKSVYKKFVDEIKGSMSENEFLDAYSLHMSDERGGFGGFGAFPFLTAIKLNF